MARVALHDRGQHEVPARQEAHAGSAAPSKRLIKDAVRYKTVLCDNWKKNGTCRYGGRCQFAHGLEEVRQRQDKTTPPAAGPAPRPSSPPAVQTPQPPPDEQPQPQLPPPRTPPRAAAPPACGSQAGSSALSELLQQSAPAQLPQEASLRLGGVTPQPLPALPSAQPGPVPAVPQPAGNQAPCAFDAEGSAWMHPPTRASPLLRCHPETGEVEAALPPGVCQQPSHTTDMVRRSISALFFDDSDPEK